MYLECIVFKIMHLSSLQLNRTDTILNQMAGRAL